MIYDLDINTKCDHCYPYSSDDTKLYPERVKESKLPSELTGAKGTMSYKRWHTLPGNMSI